MAPGGWFSVQLIRSGAVLTIAIIVVAVGLLLVLLGAVVSVIDWNRKNRAAKLESMNTHALGAAEDIKALTKLLTILKSQPLGFQLIGAGLVLVVLGFAAGAVSEVISVFN